MFKGHSSSRLIKTLLQKLKSKKYLLKYIFLEASYGFFTKKNPKHHQNVRKKVNP